MLVYKAIKQEISGKELKNTLYIHFYICIFQVHAIGPEGGMVSSTVVPQVQAVFPQGALTKKIKVGLQVNLFKPRKNHTGPMKKISVNNIPKKKRFSLIW